MASQQCAFWSEKSLISLHSTPGGQEDLLFPPVDLREGAFSSLYFHSIAVGDGLPLLFSMAELAILLPKCLFNFSVSLFFLCKLSVSLCNTLLPSAPVLVHLGWNWYFI